MDLVTVAPGHQLAPAAAASLERMRADGCPILITEAWRSRATQQQRRDAYLAGRGAFALPPGQSWHELGLAVDWKRAAATWVRAHPEHGWRFTNPDEWWHADYIAVYDRHRYRLTPPKPATTNPREDAVIILGNTASRLVSVLLNDGSWALIQDATSAAALRGAGVPSADVDDTTWARLCPAARRRHAL